LGHHADWCFFCWFVGLFVFLTNDVWPMVILVWVVVGWVVGSAFRRFRAGQLRLRPTTHEEIVDHGSCEAVCSMPTSPYSRVKMRGVQSGHRSKQEERDQMCQGQSSTGCVNVKHKRRL
jgi:hypothetical protein